MRLLCPFAPKVIYGDGCTHAPDWIVTATGAVSLESCCSGHDLWYRVGGSEADRLFADEELRDCVRVALRSRTSRLHTWLVARTIYRAVRRYGKSHWNA